jgi:hypothetical protein
MFFLKKCVCIVHLSSPLLSYSLFRKIFIWLRLVVDIEGYGIEIEFNTKSTMVLK